MREISLVTRRLELPISCTALSSRSRTVPTGKLLISFSGTGVFFTHKGQQNFIGSSCARACAAGVPQASWCAPKSCLFSSLFPPRPPPAKCSSLSLSSPGATLIPHQKCAFHVGFLLSEGDKPALKTFLALVSKPPTTYIQSRLFILTRNNQKYAGTLFKLLVSPQNVSKWVKIVRSTFFCACSTL